MTETPRAVAALGASVLPGVAAVQLAPGSGGLADCAACLLAGGLTLVGTTWPALVGEAAGDVHPRWSAQRVRAATVLGSVALTSGWSVVVDSPLGYALAGVQGVAALVAAWMSTDTPSRHRAESKATAKELGSRAQSLTVREGQLKRRVADADDQAAADRMGIRTERAALDADRAQLDRDREAFARKAAGVPEGATGTRVEVARQLFQADPSISGRKLASQLRAAGHRIDTGRVGALLDVLREAADRSAQADRAALEAVWDATETAGKAAEAEVTSG